MNRWLWLIPAFFVFCCGAACTYTKSIRDSMWYFPATAAVSLACAWLWVKSSRQLDDTNSILMLSLVWDLLMVTAYYLGPMVFKGEGLGWQTYAAALVTLIGICWFKLSI